MEVKIQSERVLAAAAKCSQAKETLKTLFPELFDGEGFIGQKIVKSKNGNRVTMATTVPSLIKAMCDHYKFGGTIKPVVVVWMESKDNSPNCHFYESWKEFHKIWELVPNKE